MTVVTGIILGSVLFGGDSRAGPSRPDDPGSSSDTGGAIESGGGSDDGFSTGGDF